MIRASFFDTSSLPTAEMLDAMRAAELGDDVYRTDPTVAALEARSAELFEREAALFVPSGTMANLVAIMVHAGRGDAVVVEAGSHIALAETGGIAAVAGCMPIAIDAPRGVVTPELLAGAVQPEDQHRPRPTLVCIENTHNRAGGTIVRPDEVAAIAAACAERGLKLHVDGARIFNAAVALDVPVATLAAGADSVTFALSKGLACPVGSVLIGTAEFVHEAQRVRKLLGGAMRQAGVLAAAGLVALETGLAQLAEDHRVARSLAERLAALPGLEVAPTETNIVNCDVRGTGRGAAELAAELAQDGIECAARPPYQLRFVTHRGVGDQEVELLLHALESRLGAR